MIEEPSKPIETPYPEALRRLLVSLGWTRSSYTLMSVFVAVLLLIMIVWWPLVEDYVSYFNPDYPFWIQLDYLLLGDFLVMSLLIMAGANLRTDALIVLVGLGGGLVIEGWGTQTQIWTYYTNERPPLWIIPAWPIASLSIDRLVKILEALTFRLPNRAFSWIYWIVFTAFYGLMVDFVSPTVHHSLTVMALLTCALLIISPTNHRVAMNTFIAGSGLGYFLELWGTTRGCWTYYTLETPPVFAVFAHGFAAVAFWRVGLLLKTGYQKWF